MTTDSGIKGFLKSWNWLELTAILLVTVAAAFCFFALPTFSNYDSIYSLLWAWELLHGNSPSFNAFRAPTQHPLAIVYSGFLVLIFGVDANRALVASTIVSYILLAAAVYRLGRARFCWTVGALAAFLLLTRRGLVFLTARSFIDIPYLAFTIWALVFEAEKPRRGGIVWVLLIGAGLLRPEGWLVAGLYWLWVNVSVEFTKGKLPRIGLRMDWKGRIWSTVYMLSAPLIWALTDFLATGDPLFSSNHTNSLAAVLNKQSSPSELPKLTIEYIITLSKFPVTVAAAVGAVVALRYKAKSAAWPIAIVVLGAGIFFLEGLAGTAVIGQPRYIAMAPVGCVLLAAYLVFGWQELPKENRLRLVWMLASIPVGLFLAYDTATLGWRSLAQGLRDRNSIQVELQQILDNPKVVAGRKCGPTTVPTHKLIPDVRWWLQAKEDAVLARADLPNGGRDVTGTALFLNGRKMLKHTAYGPFDMFVPNLDSPLILVPGDNFNRVKTGPRFAMYASCPKS